LKNARNRNARLRSRRYHRGTRRQFPNDCRDIGAWVCHSRRAAAAPDGANVLRRSGIMVTGRAVREDDAQNVSREK
jgi:hypothetical protein